MIWATEGSRGSGINWIENKTDRMMMQPRENKTQGQEHTHLLAMKR